MEGTGDTTAVTAPPALELQPGMMLGEYKLEQRVGEGGMGVVYAAVHPMIGKRAAIKILRHELCRDPDQIERFIDEARAVNRIGHPNIVDVFAFGEMPDGRSYLVMEWLQGESLRQRLERGPLTVHELCDMLRPLAKALEAAHAAGVIHRDLKPDNVFLVEQREERQVKLLDFGIAKLQRTDRTIEKTATGAIVGTPKYIAPEQAKGHAIDARVDVYSLGALAFEAVAGRPVFDADNAMEMVAKHLMEEAPRLSQIVKVPRELDDLVRAMLAKDPAERPALTHVLESLERVRAKAKPGRVATAVSGRASTPAPVRPSSRTIEPARSKLPLLLGSGGALAAAAVAFVVVRSLGSSSHQAAPVVVPDAAIAVAPAAVVPSPAPDAALVVPVAPPDPAPTPVATPPIVTKPVLKPKPAIKPTPAAKPPVIKPKAKPEPVKTRSTIKLPDDPDGIMESP